MVVQLEGQAASRRGACHVAPGAAVGSSEGTRLRGCGVATQAGPVVAFGTGAQRSMRIVAGDAGQASRRLPEAATAAEGNAGEARQLRFFDGFPGFAFRIAVASPAHLDDSLPAYGRRHGEGGPARLSGLKGGRGVDVFSGGAVAGLAADIEVRSV